MLKKNKLLSILGLYNWLHVVSFVTQDNRGDKISTSWDSMSVVTSFYYAIRKPKNPFKWARQTVKRLNKGMQTTRWLDIWTGHMIVVLTCDRQHRWAIFPEIVIILLSVISSNGLISSHMSYSNTTA